MSDSLLRYKNHADRCGKLITFLFPIKCVLRGNKDGVICYAYAELDPATRIFTAPSSTSKRTLMTKKPDFQMLHEDQIPVTSKCAIGSQLDTSVIPVAMEFVCELEEHATYNLHTGLTFVLFGAIYYIPEGAYKCLMGNANQK